MTAELFLGGLAILTLAAILIVVMTSSRREDTNNRSRTVSRQKATDR